MKYIFQPNPEGKKVKDATRGDLLEFPGDVEIYTNHPILDSDDGVTDFVETPSPAPIDPTILERKRNAMILPMGEFCKRLILRGIDPGLIDQSINSIVDNQERLLAQNEWHRQTAVKRLHPLVVSLAPAFGLSESDVDSLFSPA